VPDDEEWNRDTNFLVRSPKEVSYLVFSNGDLAVNFFGLGDEKSCFRLVPLMGVLNPSRSTRAESRLSLRRASTLVFGISRGPEPVDPWTTGLLTVGVMYIRLVGVADPVEGVIGVEKYS